MIGHRFDTAAVNWSLIGQRLDSAHELIWQAVEELQRCNATKPTQELLVKVCDAISKARIKLETPAGERWGELRSHREKST